MLEIYKRIRARREGLGISQEELAKRMGYKSRSSINKIEKGENDIPQSKIAAFAKALRTTPESLMGWEQSTAPASDDLPNISPTVTPSWKNQRNADRILLISSPNSSDSSNFHAIYAFTRSGTRTRHFSPSKKSVRRRFRVRLGHPPPPSRWTDMCITRIRYRMGLRR